METPSPFAHISERMHDRRFVVTGNEHGLSNADTVFHYFVSDGVITGAYQGGHIRTGQLAGRVTGAASIELLYHCVTTAGELLSGWSRGTVGVNAAGLSTLSFEWGWLHGATGGGQSSYVELRA